MDTDVLVTYAAMKHFHGKIKYYVSLLKVLMHLKFHKVRISIDGGEPAEKSVFLISIANGIYIGGGMPISPNSSVQRPENKERIKREYHHSGILSF